MAPIYAPNGKDPVHPVHPVQSNQPWWLTSPAAEPKACTPEPPAPAASQGDDQSPRITHNTPLVDRQAWAKGERLCDCGSQMEPAELSVNGWTNFDCSGCGHVVPVLMEASE